MPLFNRFVLNVDLKRQLTAKDRSGGQITFAQAESAVLIFKVFDNGLPYDYTSATKAKIYIKTAGNHHIETDAEIINFENGKAIRYEFEKIASVEVGFSQVILAIYEDDYVVNIQPFNVYIYDNLQGGSGSYLELIKDLMDIIEELNLDLTNTIKLIEKGVPNGVATLDKDGKIPFIQMPTQIQNFLDHINHTVFKDQVHGMIISEDGILQYKTPTGIQNAGFAPDALGSGGGNSVLNASVTVSNGVATVLYTGIPTVVAQKFAEDDRNLSYFTLNGTSFNGVNFNVTKAGLHTLWYRDSNGNTYTTLFNVKIDQLLIPTITIEVVEGIVSFIIDKPTSIVKWDNGVRDIPYFAYNGKTINGNSFIVKDIGKYTIYYKLTNGVEYVEVFEVTADMLPLVDTTPPEIVHVVIYGAGEATIKIQVIDSESGVDYIITPDNKKVIGDKVDYKVQNNGTFEFQAYDKAGNSSKLSVIINSITLKVPTITLNSSPVYATNGVVTITAYTNSNITGGTIALTKWASGNRASSYFATSGTVYTGNTFTVTENGTYTVYAKDSFGAEAVKTIDIIVIDKVPPSILLSKYPTSYTNGAVTVTATITDNASGISSVKYATGVRDISYFTSSGSTLPANNSINVTTNSTYTIYAKDGAGNATIQTIIVDNIHKTAPIINLSQSPTVWTKDDITITANITSSIPLTDIKWASGTQTASYFNSGGSSFSSSFKVSSNGTYTVYAKDSAGNTTAKTIGVTKIDKIPPTIKLSASALKITATISDGDSGVSVRKWASGYQSASYFDNYGTTFTGTSITTSSSGVYTVYAKDNAGNATVENISVTSGGSGGGSLAITLEVSPTTYNDRLVTIDVSGGSSLSRVKYDSGSRTASYFASNGIDVEDLFFTTTTAGTYTVYVRDSNGNEAVKTVNVTIQANTTGARLNFTGLTGAKGVIARHVNINGYDNISEIQIAWNINETPLPISFFRDKKGVFPTVTADATVRNYSTFYSYYTERYSANGQLNTNVPITFKNITQGYFGAYVKLKTGEDFIYWVKAIQY